VSKPFVQLTSSVKGPTTTFNEYDVVECLLLIGREGVIGRGRLGSKLGLGGGAVRTLISKLKSKNYITVNKKGCSLTSKGKEVFNNFTSKIVFYTGGSCLNEKLDKVCFTVCVRNVSDNIGKGVRLRDQAVRAGANGALILRYRGGEFFFIDEDVSCEKTQPSPLWGRLKSDFGFKENDLVIVAFAKDKKHARDGALAAALLLFRQDA
jgi:hypothetical protein